MRAKLPEREGGAGSKVGLLLPVLGVPSTLRHLFAVRGAPHELDGRGR